MKLSAFALLALTTIACGSSPVAPTPSPAAIIERIMAYDINVPTALLARNFRASYPDGVRVSPIQAQRDFDYTAAYRGSPNVYEGETMGCQYQYVGVGVVVAPLGVASQARFTAADWPNIGLDPGVVYVWVGRFTYAMPAPAEWSVPNPHPGVC